MSIASGCLPQILLLEDDLPWGRLFTAGLDLGASVVWAKDVASARRELQIRPFDVIVSDLRLPGGGLRELLSGLPRTSGRPKVLLVSGDPDIEDAARDCRADEWLPKPVGLKKLRATVASLLQAPVPVLIGRAPHGMIVSTTDLDRIEAAAVFLAEGLRAGERTVAVVEERLRTRVSERIAALAGGIPGPSLIAAETVGEQVLEDGMPSRLKLRPLAASILADPTDLRPLRFYGEGVEMLAARGLHRAAIHLERLWNEVLPVTGVRLLCGFASGSWSGASCTCLRDLEGEHLPAS